MKVFQGVCQYCGNIQPVMAETQEEADKRVATNCECGEAPRAQMKERLMECLDFLAVGTPGGAFIPLTDVQKEMLRTSGCEVILDTCKAVTFEFTDSKIKIWQAKDKIKAARSGTRKSEVEA